MSLPRFFLKHQIVSDEIDEVFNVRLDDADLKHARVLRLAPGEHIAIVDASSDYFECRIVSFDNIDLRVAITQRGDLEAAKATVVLAQAIAKGDKVDTVIRQGTEIGVSGFVPFFAERSIVRLDEQKAEKRLNRWQEIAKSASMQSGRRTIPEILPPTNLVGLADFAAQANAIAVCWEEASTNDICAAVGGCLAGQFIPYEDARVIIVVGPEGGLAEYEVERLLASNTHCFTVSLGETILRTETAGLVASALVIHELGGLR